MKRELRGWAGLAMLSLAIAGVFALLLALSRTPGVQDIFPWPLGFFHKGLVIHVVFSFIVWFLAVFGALTVIVSWRLGAAGPKLRFLGMPALIGAYASTALLFVPAFLDRGEATLNNYIPAITDPIYYAGLAVLGAAVGLMVLRLLASIPSSEGRWKEPLPFAVTAAGLSFGVALICFLIAAFGVRDWGLSYELNESLFWGGGHVMQFVNTSLLIAALYALGRITLKGAFADRELMLTALSILFLYSGIGIIVTLKYAPVHDKYWSMLTNLQYGMAFPVLLFAVPALLSALKARAHGPLPWKDPAFLCLALAPVLFAVGGILGLFVDGGDTRTPAHYHGVIAGINLAFMGLFYTLFLPLLDRSLRRGKAVYAQVYMFAGGQLMACVGLFWAGGFGAPRKTAGVEQGLHDLGAIIGMYMNGVGAVIAVIGGIMFIWMVSKALLEAPPHPIS